VPPGSGTVAKVLTGDRLSTAEFRELDDVSVLGCFKAWSHSADPQLARLCRGLLDRRLYKTIDLSAASDVRAAVRRAMDAVTSAGGDPVYSLFFDNPGNEPYVPGDQGILVVGPGGETRDFAEASPFVKGLEARLSFGRLHVAGEYYQRAKSALGA
jgi:hypothetical protein